MDLEEEAAVSVMEGIEVHFWMDFVEPILLFCKKYTYIFYCPVN